ncbi:MAG: AbrB/MazE/SpoVT family DNA-binding domain-containing protein [Spirochaetaceae bacterium]|nr:AbrB/MazE/SpoVT family DNA-binding domain-containing protein [Spirochaetaceae bacterium]
MEKVYSDKIIKRGPGSVAVKIPMALRERFGLKEGDPIDYYIEGESLILKFPKAGAAEPETF